MLDLLAGVHPDAIGHSLDPHIRWVLEEGYRRPALKYRLQKSDLIGMWLEDAVREASLFLLDEFLIKRVLYEEAFNFLLCED